MAPDMVSSSFSQSQQEKRICQRIELNRSVQVKLPDGSIITGLTDDISLSGLKVITRDFSINYLSTDQAELMASLQLKSVDGSLSNEYPCSIVRVEPGVICLKMDSKRAASFSLLLTQGIFKQSLNTQ